MNHEARYYIYPSIANRAYKDKCYSVGYRQWAVLASSIEDFEKPMSVPDVVDAMEQALGTKRRNTYDVLTRCNGIYWNYTRGTGPGRPGSVTIYAPEDVARVMGVAMPYEVVKRPLSEARGRSHRRGYYSAMLEHIAKPGVPTRRVKIANLSGIPVRTHSSTITTRWSFPAPPTSGWSRSLTPAKSA